MRNFTLSIEKKGTLNINFLKSLFYCLFYIILLFNGKNSLAQAELYKWVDDQGKTHYSDRNPKEHEHSTISTTASPSQQAFDRNTKLKPIILPYGKVSRKLLLSEGLYRWKQPAGGKQKLGVYYLGRFCTSRGAIYAADVYSDHPRFLPSENAIPKTLKKAIVNLGYDVHSTLLYDLDDRMEQLKGLYLKAEIVKLDLHSCAPIYSLMRTISPKKIPWSNFTKNRVSVSIQWQLISSPEQAPLFKTTTQGYFDNWDNNKKADQTIKQAIVIASNNLFADQQFIDLITTDPAKKADKLIPANPGTEKRSWWQSFAPDTRNPISDLIGKQFVMRAKVSSVLAETSMLKVSSVNYFMTNNDWPRITQDIGLSDRVFENHEFISGMKLNYDGTFTLHLREDVFGPSRVLRMTPDTDSYREKRSLQINWDCSSNLPQEILPEMCVSM